MSDENNVLSGDINEEGIEEVQTVFQSHGQYYFGPYSLFVTLAYEPDLDVNVESNWKPEEFSKKQESLQYMVNFFAEQMRDFFAWRAGRQTFEEVEIERQNKAKEVYTIDALHDKLMKDFDKNDE